MSIPITIDEAELQRAREQLGTLADKAPNVIANSLNRTVASLGAGVTKEVRKNYNIKAADIRKTLTSFRANRSNLSAKVESKGKVIGLENFKVSPKTVNPKRKSQLKISVKKGSTKQILGAFVANLTGIKITKRDGKARLPISRLMGPSVPQMIRNEGIAPHDLI